MQYDFPCSSGILLECGCILLPELMRNRSHCTCAHWIGVVGIVAASRLRVAALAHDVGQSAAEHGEAFGARVCVLLDVVSYSCINFAIFSNLSATFVPLTMKTTDDTLISPVYSLSQIIRRFDSHPTLGGIATTSFSA